MRGCAFSMLLITAGWAATVGGTMFAVQRAYVVRPSDAFGVGLLAGSLAWVALSCAWVAVRTAIERSRLAAGAKGERPTDGRQAVLVGRLEAVGPRLVAPLHGAECVAYQYRILRETRVRHRQSIIDCYRGVGLSPAVLVTGTGSYRLLAVPEFEGEYTPLDRPTAVANARAYIARTAFGPARGAKELEARWTDADGEYRSDVTWVTGQAVDIDECILEEAVVPAGAEVTLIGLYSQDRGGIVAHPNWGKPTRLLMGDAALARAALRSRITLMIAIALLCAGAAAIFVALFVAGRPAA